jgi:Rrf2 family protein
MTLLSRKADYALLILWYLHHHAEGGCARAIADRFQLSRAFVANILKELCQQGFIASQRGANGGYTLLRSVQELNLAELLAALDEPFQLAPCSHEGADTTCTLANLCPVRGPIALVHRKLHELLRTVTLAELFTASAAEPPLLPLLVPLPPPGPTPTFGQSVPVDVNRT